MSWKSVATTILIVAAAALISWYFWPRGDTAPVGSSEATDVTIPDSWGASTERPVYQRATEEDIVVTLPFPGAVTGKDFSVRGKAQGDWFRDGRFPVALFDQSGVEIASAFAIPEPPRTEWQTDESLSFKADIRVPESFSGPATLVAIKNDPTAVSINDIPLVAFAITVEY